MPLQVEFARKVGPQFLTYYEKYFDVEYPLPKQDMVAIPDFNAGAMENWGLITYRYILQSVVIRSKDQRGFFSGCKIIYYTFNNINCLKLCLQLYFVYVTIVPTVVVLCSWAHSHFYRNMFIGFILQ